MLQTYVCINYCIWCAASSMVLQIMTNIQFYYDDKYFGTPTFYKSIKLDSVFCRCCGQTNDRIFCSFNWNITAEANSKQPATNNGIPIKFFV